MSLVLEIDQNFPQPGIVEHLVEVVNGNHGVFIYPTDTIYGLGCSIKDEVAIEKIKNIKKREGSKSFSVLFKDVTQIKKYALVNKEIEKTLNKYLPGPFTFILKAKKGAPNYLLGPNKTIGVRIPQNKLCLAIVKSIKSPIITTSVNLSGLPPLTNPTNITQSLKKEIDIILDAGELGSKPSTVVDLTQPTPIILRYGSGNFTN